MNDAADVAVALVELGFTVDRLLGITIGANVSIPDSSTSHSEIDGSGFYGFYDGNRRRAGGIYLQEQPLEL